MDAASPGDPDGDDETPDDETPVDDEVMRGAEHTAFDTHALWHPQSRHRYHTITPY